LLELHSAKSSKAEVLSQFDQSLKAAGRKTVDAWQAEAQRLGRLRHELNEYVDALHQQHQNGLTVYQATAILVSKPGWNPCGFTWTSPSTHTAEELGSIRELTRQISTIGGLIVGLEPAVFNYIQWREWTPSWQEKFIGTVQLCQERIDILDQAYSAALSAIDLPDVPRTFMNLGHFSRFCSVIVNAGADSSSLLGQEDLTRSRTLLQGLISNGLNRTKIWGQMKEQYR